jgi:hypothetical protein
LETIGKNKEATLKVNKLKAFELSDPDRKNYWRFYTSS